MLCPIIRTVTIVFIRKMNTLSQAFHPILTYDLAILMQEQNFILPSLAQGGCPVRGALGLSLFHSHLLACNS